MMMIIMICSRVLFSLQRVDERRCVAVSTIIITGNLNEKEKEGERGRAREKRFFSSASQSECS